MRGKLLTGLWKLGDSRTALDRVMVLEWHPFNPSNERQDWKYKTQ